LADVIRFLLQNFTRTAAVVAPACFLFGAAGTHLMQMVTTHNFAPGNAGMIFYADILLPLIGFTLLWLERRHSRAEHRNQ
jgi:cytochrome c biogenesis factor